jgi:hypothetical protein
MNRSWSGFLPQNEMVKLQWAVMEGRDLQKTVMALRALSRHEKKDPDEETRSKFAAWEYKEQH